MITAAVRGRTPHSDHASGSLFLKLVFVPARSSFRLRLPAYLLRLVTAAPVADLGCCGCYDWSSCPLFGSPDWWYLLLMLLLNTMLLLPASSNACATTAPPKRPQDASHPPPMVVPRNKCLWLRLSAPVASVHQPPDARMPVSRPRRDALIVVSTAAAQWW
jgi:hypothetical protein